MSDTTVSNRETALSLAAAGFSVFPCHSGGEKAKSPMPFIKWREASTTSERQILQWWQKWPDAAIGLDLAKSGLIVIDADRHDESADGVEAFGQLMSDHGFDPDSAPLVATPSQGNHHYFRQRPGEALGNSEGAIRGKGINVRGHGGYVIAPGTVMADGRVYELWGDITDPPVIPDWLHGLITTPLEPVRERVSLSPTPSHEQADLDEIAELLGYINPDSGYQDWLAALMAVHAATGGSSTGLAVADDWSARGSKYKGTKELAAKWRSFKGQGVNLATLAALARENGADLSAIAIKHRGHEHDYDPVEAAEAARRLIEHHDGTLADAETGEVVQIEQNVQPERVTNIDYPPGLVGDVARWIVATARKPQPALAIGAALTIVGTAAGRQFMGPTEAGTALYVLALAPTGQGKDLPLKQARRILNASSLPHHLGADEFMSFSAVVNVLKRRPLCLCPMDEFGDFMRRIYDKRASSHARAISKIFRTMWGGNFDEVSTAEWAEKESISIWAPHLSIFGASTHEQFYTALESGAVSDGTLNRFLLIEGAKRPKPVKPKADQFIVPRQIIDDMRIIYFRSGEMAASNRIFPDTDIAGTPGAAFRMKWCADGSEEFFATFSRDIENKMFAEPENVDFIVRTAEMAVRIATIVAAGRHNDSIRLDDIQFGANLAMQSADLMIAGAADYMAETDHQANAQRVVRIIRERGGRMVYRDIARAMKHMKARDIKDMMAGLCEMEILRREEIQKPSGGHPVVWFSAT
ncbi:bifunctional DNA primase/polymerase [Hoeflea alexandrii]|uniref:DNA primase/polymerase bifunctional N-terminal domain-containing protein n=1 Tax=Hoeflea alexandrii TaxID=288436 RepID=A0ABT1CM91_9HYPH|nr:bifunctional DNA primase/polymerase [Hoeflea alexandrii]MCO6407342.1 hypothetical protein [Hoeflea alexandrii]MCY0154261.1 bifunctional DNA primase/polymerase [Hoeflea alexandrii]